MINVKLDKKAKNTVAKTLNLGGGQGGGSELYTYYVSAEDYNDSTHTLTFQCDNSELDSYDKLAQYLLSKGYYAHYGDEDDYTPVLVVSSNGMSSGNIINGLYGSQEEGRLWIHGSSLYVSSGTLDHSYVDLKSEEFTITLITE